MTALINLKDPNHTILCLTSMSKPVIIFSSTRCLLPLNSPQVESETIATWKARLSLLMASGFHILNTNLFDWQLS
jgi:hypothetical protein